MLRLTLSLPKLGRREIMGNKKNKKFVLDTNVLLQAMGATLAPLAVKQNFMKDRRVLEHALEHGTLCATEQTWAEFTEIALSPRVRMDMAPLRPTSMRQRQTFVEQLRAKVLMVAPAPITQRCDDGKDTMFLQAAAGAGAQYLLTHDGALLQLRLQGTCVIIRPQAFLARLDGVPAPLPRTTPRQGAQP